MKRRHRRPDEEEYDQKVQVIEMIIERIYPEKRRKDLKKKLHEHLLIDEEESEEEYQENYRYQLNNAIGVVTTMLEEYKLFGFDDLKQVKGKNEPEVDVRTAAKVDAQNRPRDSPKSRFKWLWNFVFILKRLWELVPKW